MAIFSHSAGHLQYIVAVFKVVTNYVKFLIISELTNNPTMPGGGASNLGKYLMKKDQIGVKVGEWAVLIRCS